jgi:hypothetical protein
VVPLIHVFPVLVCCTYKNLATLVLPNQNVYSHRNIRTRRRMPCLKMDYFPCKARQVQSRCSPSCWTKSFTTKNYSSIY